MNGDVRQGKAKKKARQLNRLLSRYIRQRLTSREVDVYGEVGIGQPEAKGEGGPHALFLIILVAHQAALSVYGSVRSVL